MSYLTMSQCANDVVFQSRIVACCAQEGSAQPETDAFNMRWNVATAGDVAAAYESAVIANNPDPGGDPTVITDQMILSNVQANLPSPPP